MSRWPLVPLGDLGANVRNACVGGPFGSELTTRDYVGSPGVPVIRGSNLGEDGFIDDGFVYVSDTKAQALRQNQARPGDITFTQRGTVGQVAIIPSSARYGHYIISQSQMKLTPDLGRVEPRFLVHYFKSADVRRFLKNSTLATGVPHINLTILRRLPVPLPPLNEQRRIADILDKAGAIRRKRKEAIARTEELLRSAFLDIFGDPVTNPKGWGTVLLGQVAEFVGGGTPSRAVPDYYTGAICWATSKDMKGEELLDTEEHITERAIGESATKLVPAGSILVVVKSKILLHTLPVLLAARPTCFGQDLKAILPSNRVPTRYLARHLRVGARALLARARGVNTEGLTLDHLRNYALMLPPTAEMRAFADLDAEITAVRGRLLTGRSLTEDLFDGLVQRAFSGRLSTVEARC